MEGIVLPSATRINVDRPLLVRDNTLEGVHQIGVRLRPLRLAYLLPEGNINLAATTMDALFRLWGGVNDFLIPCPSGGAPTPSWERILEQFDPDGILDLAGASEETEARHKVRDRFYRRWTEPERGPPMTGATIYGFLDRYMAPSGQPKPRLASVCVTEENPWFLPLLSRVGRVAELPFPRDSEFGGQQGRSFSRTHEIVELQPPGDPGLATEWLLDPYAQIPDDWTPGNGLPRRTRRLADLGRLGLDPREPPWSHMGNDQLRQRIEDQSHLQRIVIIGDARSIPNLCLFWNLRAQRVRTEGFPAWITTELLGTPTLARSLVNASGRVQEYTEQRNPEILTINLISASESEQALQSAVNDVSGPFQWRFITSEFEHLFRNDFEVQPLTYQAAIFEDGRASISYPPVGDLTDWAWLERFIRETKVTGYHPPHVPGHRLMRYASMGRVTSDGSYALFTTASPPPDTMQQIHHPDGWKQLGVNSRPI